ncbi:MAG TPA: hypothetical protein PKK06_04355 [Phycisphaerae bacterium]|nr:hypothetical protein [Phycisphaerae bacterium]HNU46179.1 hypothetical protein [Phycisphaerae bacterium]
MVERADIGVFLQLLLEGTFGLPEIVCPRLAFLLATGSCALFWAGVKGVGFRDILGGFKFTPLHTLALLGLLAALGLLRFGVTFAFFLVAFVRTAEGHCIGEYLRARGMGRSLILVVAVISVSVVLLMVFDGPSPYLQVPCAILGIILSVKGVCNRTSFWARILPEGGRAVAVSGIVGVLLAAHLFVPGNRGLSFAYSVLVPFGVAISIGCWPIVECLRNDSSAERVKAVSLPSLALSSFLFAPLLGATAGMAMLYGVHVADKPSMADYEGPGKLEYWIRAGRGQEYLEWAQMDFAQRSEAYERRQLSDIFPPELLPLVVGGQAGGYFVIGSAVFGAAVWLRRNAAGSD